MEGIYYRLFFKDDTIIIARFFGSSDSDNVLDLDDPDFEELYEFDFIVEKIEVIGTDLKFEEKEWITLDYRNFFDKFEIYNGEISNAPR